MPGFTFVASISAIVYARATPVLAEVDDSFNLDPADVEARITPRTRAIIVVHMLGAPARLDELKDVADRHGIPIIEDCAQAFGASYQGQGVGGIGATGVYSFNEYKTITCGDGGMIVTDDEDLYGRLFAIHDQGHAPNRLGSKYAERPFLGMNFRMTELSGAVLLAQVRKLDLIRTHLRANKKIVKSMIARPARARVPDGGRSRGRPRHAPRRDVPVGGGRAEGREGARLDHARRVRLARLLEHGAPARATDRQRQGLPLRLLVLRRGRSRVPPRDAARDRRAAGALVEHRHRRVRHEPGAVRAAHARRRGGGAAGRPSGSARSPRPTSPARAASGGVAQARSASAWSATGWPGACSMPRTSTQWTGCGWPPSPRRTRSGRRRRPPSTQGRRSSRPSTSSSLRRRRDGRGRDPEPVPRPDRDPRAGGRAARRRRQADRDGRPGSRDAARGRRTLRADPVRLPEPARGR